MIKYYSYKKEQEKGDNQFHIYEKTYKFGISAKCLIYHLYCRMKNTTTSLI